MASDKKPSGSAGFSNTFSLIAFENLYATWTVLFITAVSLIAAVTPLGKVPGSAEVSNLLLYSVIGLLASRASLLELGDAPAWILTGFIILAIHSVLMLVICRVLKQQSKNISRIKRNMI